MYARNIPQNGTPANVIYGTKDDSLLDRVLTPVADNIHTPLIFGYAPKGKGNSANRLVGETLLKMHGSEVVQNGNKYSTFNTPFVKMFNEKVNTMLFHRLIPDDAETASLRYYAEAFTKEIDAVVRDEFGNIVYEDDNTTPKVNGKKTITMVVWRVAPFTKDLPFRQATKMSGTNKNVDGSDSVLFPIYDLPAPYEGDYCRKFRFSLACLNVKSQVPVNSDLIESVGSRLFRMSVREATETNLVGNYITTLKGGTGVTFSHVKNARDINTNTVYGYNYTVERAYINKRPQEGLPAFPGPMDAFHVYEANLNELLTLLGAAEGIDPLMVDPFTAMTVDAVPYNNVVVDNGPLGGEILNESHYHNMIGGSDGTMSNDLFDVLVRREMEAFGDREVKYYDMLRYPCSTLWDAGFSLKTKEAMAQFMGRRPDCGVFLSTFVYNQPQNTVEVESSMVLALAGYLRAFPESVRYSTDAMRGYIVGQDYLLNDESYLDRLPTLYHLASMLADYAGKPRLDPDFRFFDGGEYTVIDTGYDVSLPWKPNAVYENDYANGLIYAISYDDHRFFYPSLISIYNIKRSVLVGMLPTTVCGDLMRVSQRVWAETTGNQTMSEQEYCDYVAQKIINKTTDKYDTVKDIRVDVYMTEEDRSAGNQCTIDIYVGFNTTKNVHKVSIIAQRGGTVNGEQLG